MNYVQLKQVQLDISVLDRHRSQLGVSFISLKLQFLIAFNMCYIWNFISLYTVMMMPVAISSDVTCPFIWLIYVALIFINYILFFFLFASFLSPTSEKISTIFLQVLFSIL